MHTSHLGRWPLRGVQPSRQSAIRKPQVFVVKVTVMHTQDNV